MKIPEIESLIKSPILRQQKGYDLNQELQNPQRELDAINKEIRQLARIIKFSRGK